MMLRLPISKRIIPGKYWLVYVDDNGVKKHMDLCGCAGSFEHSIGYVSEDGLRAVGWRYEENGQLCYELFNVGHTVFYAPIKPSLFRVLGYMLSGKKPENAHNAFLTAFEESLNQCGWKTIERKER